MGVHEDFSLIEECCCNCGVSAYTIDQFDVITTIRAIEEMEFDSPHEVRFCTFDCYKEWVLDGGSFEDNQ